MIREFSVENYRSIKDKQGISFIPNMKMNYGIEKYVLLDAAPNVKLLKFAVLYGYNASGKSTILESFDYLRAIQLNAHFSKNETTGFEPFAFDKKKNNKIGKFHLSFYLDQILYEYSITLDGDRIYNEELKYTPGKRITLLYHREWNEKEKISDILFSTKLELTSKSKTILIGNCIENNTVLASYSRSNVNSKELDKVFDYFNNYLGEVVKPKADLNSLTTKNAIHDDDSRRLYSILLKKAELQISDIKVVDECFDDKKPLINALEKIEGADDLLGELGKKEEIKKKLVFEHTNTYGSFNFSRERESNGTIRYFGLEGIMQKLLSDNKFVAIDEFDTSLHPELLSRYIEIFLVNSKNSQLLITINNLYLMDQDYMRPDMIWFCEKTDDGSSVYYNAQDFKYHKRISTYKHYRDGKFGAMPHYGNAMIEDLNTADVIN
jgi:AAA15 family ATPase/GTPase